jgi:hypothetical protein
VPQGSVARNGACEDCGIPVVLVFAQPNAAAPVGGVVV